MGKAFGKLGRWVKLRLLEIIGPLHKFHHGFQGIVLPEVESLDGALVMFPLLVHNVVKWTYIYIIYIYKQYRKKEQFCDVF